MREFDFLMSKLPKRIECKEDENDAFAVFEMVANSYVSARIPHAEIRYNHPRRFWPEHDICHWHEKDLKELGELVLPEGERKRLMELELIPSRVALNAIADLKRRLLCVSEELVRVAALCGDSK